MTKLYETNELKFTDLYLIEASFNGTVKQLDSCSMVQLYWTYGAKLICNLLAVKTN